MAGDKATVRQANEPVPPQAGPRDTDQVNLTDEESRVMPVSGGGYEQCYNAQAAVDTETMLILTTHVSHAPNDKREIAPTLATIDALPQALGKVQVLLADSGYFSAANTQACATHGIEPLLSNHQNPIMGRWWSASPPMCHRRTPTMRCCGWRIA